MRDLVEPVDRRTVFISETRSDPNNTSRLQRRGVSQYLSQMAVIRFFQLIFDQDMGTAENILANNIRGIGPDGNLLTDQFQIEPQLFG
ncbi:hypothetical protein SDC9_161341 [bioreactor metagenome]|uniref:Uncharacterized protein n=1 Tax=bioreactor metagenome TaxID=1076179 RepID=A0A645FHV9_9ZZZZ